MSQDLSNISMSYTFRPLPVSKDKNDQLRKEKMSELRKKGQCSRKSKSCQTAKEVFFKAVYCVAEAITLQNSILKQKQSHLGSKTRTEHELLAVPVCSGSDTVFRMKECNLQNNKNTKSTHTTFIKSISLQLTHLFSIANITVDAVDASHTEAPMGLAGLV